MGYKAPGGSSAAATESAAGIVELATTAEIDAGTSATTAMSPDQFQASKRNVRHIVWEAVGLDTDCAASDSTVLAWVCSPVTGVITSVIVDTYTAGQDTAGSALATFDVHLNGTTIMSATKVTLDETETTSRTATTAAVLSTTAITAGDKLTFYCDAVGDTPPKGAVFTVSIREA